MTTLTQHGYLILADISGYTSYLAGVELDHAHEILTDLLTAIVNRFKTLLTISKLEGDAVFAYTPESKLSRGEILLELVESTYVLFHDRIQSSHRHTTCQCRACQGMSGLDLKFFIHHGDYIVQEITGIRELVGSDVNLAHRLMKNHVAEATGWRAYVMITERGLEHLGVRPEGGHAQLENYEHLGDVPTLCFNLRERYEQLMANRRVVVGPQQACLTYQRHYPAPPPVVWDWLNDPLKRAQYTFQKGLMFKDVLKPGGRKGVGSKTHCIHGKDVAMEETVLDWKPFDYLTVQQVFSGFVMRLTFQLEPVDDGTRLTMYIDGESPAPGPLKRPVFKWVMTQFFPMSKPMEKMGQCIAEALAGEPAVEPPGALATVGPAE
jgi:uncharacterized protein YndB with AHSA1/START domain